MLGQRSEVVAANGSHMVADVPIFPTTLALTNVRGLRLGRALRKRPITTIRLASKGSSAMELLGEALSSQGFADGPTRRGKNTPRSASMKPQWEHTTSSLIAVYRAFERNRFAA